MLKLKLMLMLKHTTLLTCLCLPACTRSPPSRLQEGGGAVPRGLPPAGQRPAPGQQQRRQGAAGGDAGGEAGGRLGKCCRCSCSAAPSGVACCTGSLQARRAQGCQGLPNRCTYPTSLSSLPSHRHRRGPSASPSLHWAPQSRRMWSRWAGGCLACLWTTASRPDHWLLVSPAAWQCRPAMHSLATSTSSPRAHALIKPAGPPCILSPQVAALREAVLYLVRSTETALHTFKRSYAWREAAKVRGCTMDGGQVGRYSRLCAVGRNHQAVTTIFLCHPPISSAGVSAAGIAGRGGPASAAIHLSARGGGRLPGPPACAPGGRNRGKAGRGWLLPAAPGCCLLVRHSAACGHSYACLLLADTSCIVAWRPAAMQAAVAELEAVLVASGAAGE